MKTSASICALVAALGVSAKTYDVYRQAPQPQQRHRVMLAATAADAATNKAPESVRGGAWLTADDIGAAVGTIVVPQARMPTEGPTGNNQAGLYMASFWVGLGCADTADSPLLRAGVDIFWDGGMETYNAWHQWYPNPSTAFDVSAGNFSIVPGDRVRMGAVAPGEDGTPGLVRVENLSRGGEVRYEFAAGQGAGAAPCGTGAAWVVEDFTLAGLPDVPVALANFSSTTFEDAHALTAAKHARTISAKKARLFDISLQDQGGKLTSCSISGRKNVVCSRMVENP
ncbi:uncharacterized protein E0L32_009880 [Thyridium curvatum]|uniref:Uncharacterized protein n=1 Tax=Thyridium curvatum TaxID=1093900 RepID=A0A507AUW2_9PEZI|nr:uncharacterized protein E0L32_009880 [Thyridium curvatum]TPX08691.1 hypothetical protein E0L32_009880 [Thyridium curvatum]